MTGGANAHSAAIARLLARIAGGPAARKTIGRSTREIDQAAVGQLVAADLVARRPDGRLSVTSAGRAFLARAMLARSGVDPYLGQHLALGRGAVDTPAGSLAVMIDDMESPLAWLARRKGKNGRPTIEPDQLQAGERLRADFTRAQLMPRVTSNWNSPIANEARSAHAGGAAVMTEAIVAARQRVRRALDAVGPEFAGLLVDLCCFLKGLEDVERERGWPARSGKVVLQLGLDRLARHYGLSAAARGNARSPTRTWVAPEEMCAPGDAR